MFVKPIALTVGVLITGALVPLAAHAEEPGTPTTGQSSQMPMMMGQPGSGMPMMMGRPGAMYSQQGQEGGGQTAEEAMPSGMPMWAYHQQRMAAMRQQGGMPWGPCYQQPGMAGEQGDMPMEQGQSGYMPMMMGPRGMMNPGMMPQWRESMMQHRQAMEQHMANIEALLRELVELEKAK